MQTEWIYEYYAFVAVEDAAAVNGAMALVVPNPADAETFTVACSPDGTGDPTHFGTICPATVPMVAVLDAAVGRGLPVTFWRVMRVDGTLVSTNGPAGTIGEVFTWQDALGAMGLRV